MAADEIRQASEQFYMALNKLFTGDLGPMEAIWSHADDVTNMDPIGERIVGWEAVRAQLAREADMHFKGEVIPEDMLAVQSGEMGYTICIERSENLSVDSMKMPTALHIRATNIFRKENGAWKMVLHHTDQAAGLQEMMRGEQE